eukprot:56939-Rhodomonas_salina.2
MWPPSIARSPTFLAHTPRFALADAIRKELGQTVGDPDVPVSVASVTGEKTIESLVCSARHSLCDTAGPLASAQHHCEPRRQPAELQRRRAAHFETASALDAVVAGVVVSWMRWTAVAAVADTGLGCVGCVGCAGLRPAGPAAGRERGGAAEADGTRAQAPGCCRGQGFRPARCARRAHVLLRCCALLIRVVVGRAGREADDDGMQGLRRFGQFKVSKKGASSSSEMKPASHRGACAQP